MANRLKTKAFILFLALLPASARCITIEECYRLARDNFPLTAQYGIIEKIGEYSFSNACRSYLPQLSFLAQATLQNEVSDFPEEMRALYKKVGIEMEGLSKDQYKVMLQLNQKIWDGGSTKAQKAQIAAETEVNRLRVEKEADAVRERVNQVYFGMLVLQAQLQQAENLRSLLLANKKTVDSQVKNGVALPSDAELIQVEIVSLGQKIVKIEMAAGAYRHVLGLLIGKELSGREPIERPSPAPVEEECLRTELKLFDAQIRQQNALRGSIWADNLPHLDFFVQGYYGRPGFNLFNDMMYDDFSWNAIGGIRLQWNISALYTRSNLLWKIGLAQESIGNDRALFEWNIAQQKTEKESNIAEMAEVSRRDVEIVGLRTSIRQASESQYKNGVVTINELLRNINNESDAQLAAQLHELELLKNGYDLKLTMNW